MAKRKPRKRTWKDVDQKVGRRPTSPLALRRKLIRVARGVGLVLSFASLVALAWFGPKWYAEQGQAIDLTGPSQAMAKLEFVSDGELDAVWFTQWNPIPQGTSLMEVDIQALRQSLEAIGQIQSADVKRFFPDTLHVEVKERRPVMRLNTCRPDEEQVEHLVSNEGFVFAPINFKPTLLSNLPHLTIDSSRLVEIDEGFELIEGVAEVTQLLDLARRNYPALYRDWKIVSFERMGPAYKDDLGSHVLIQSEKIREIRFSPHGFPEQMRRLKYLMHEPDVQRSIPIENIDLSLGEWVFVQTN